MVWTLFSSEEPILLNPDPDGFTEESNPGKDKVVLDELFNTYTKDYKAQQPRCFVAIMLLDSSLDDVVKAPIDEIDDPNDVWKILADYYRMNDQLALEIVLSKMENLKLDDYKSMQDYVNQATMLQADVRSTGDDFTNSALVAKILRGLTPRYRPLRQIIHLNSDVQTNLYATITKLLTFEAETAKDDAKKKVQKKKNVTCSYDPCGKLGHTENECRKKRADQNKQSKGKDQSSKSSNQRSNRNTSSSTNNDKAYRQKGDNSGAWGVYSNKAKVAAYVADFDYNEFAE